MLGATADDWSCDPYNPLFGLYTENRRYDQGWEVVHKARKSRKWIEPELLDRIEEGFRTQQLNSSSYQALGLCGRRLPKLDLIPLNVIDPGKAAVGFIHALGVNLYSLLL